MIDAANKAGYPYSSQCSLPSLYQNALCDGGLVIISRFPIINEEFKPFITTPSQADGLA